MRFLPLILSTMIISSYLLIGSSIKFDKIETITKESMNVLKFEEIIANSIYQGYQSVFEVKNCIGDRLSKMKPSEAAEYFASQNFLYKNQDQIFLNLQQIVQNSKNSITSGDFEKIHVQIKDAVSEYIHFRLSQKDDDNRYFLVSFVDEFPQKLLENIVSEVQNSHVNNPILENLTGSELQSAKLDLEEKIQQHNLSMVIIGTKLRAVLAGNDKHRILPEVSSKNLNAIQTAFQSLESFIQSNDSIFETEVLPLLVFAHKQKYRTFWGDRHLFLNRVVEMILKSLSKNQISKVLKTLFEINFQKESKKISKHENYEKFLEYINTRVSEKTISSEYSEDKYVLFDYLACNPNEFLTREFSEEEQEKMLSISSNINNFSFILDFFKYYRVETKPVYDFLYSEFADVRKSHKDYKFLRKDFSKHMSEYLYRKHSDNKKTAEFIPISFILSKMVIDNSIFYYSRQFNYHDKAQPILTGNYQWHDLFSNDDNYIIDYKRMYNKKQKIETLPRIRFGTITNIVVPVESHLSKQEKNLLRNPYVLDILKKAYDAGEKTLSVKDIDPNYEIADDEEVIIVLVKNRKTNVCSN